MISFPVQKELRKSRDTVNFRGEGGREGALRLMYLLITVYIYKTVYMCIEIVIIYISIYVSSMKLFFDRCVPKIVRRCVISLCAI